MSDLFKKDGNPFIGIVENKEGEFEIYDKYSVYIINPTNREYSNIKMLSGMFCGDSDGLIESSKFVKDFGVLKPRSALKIDTIGFVESDYVVWYSLDFFTKGKEKPTSCSFDIPKYFTFKGNTTEWLPILYSEGLRIGLTIKYGSEPISELIKTLDMNGKYTPTESNSVDAGQATIDALRRATKDMEDAT